MEIPTLATSTILIKKTAGAVIEFRTARLIRMANYLDNSGDLWLHIYFPCRYCKQLTPWLVWTLVPAVQKANNLKITGLSRILVSFGSIAEGIAGPAHDRRCDHDISGADFQFTCIPSGHQLPDRPEDPRIGVLRPSDDVGTA